MSFLTTLPDGYTLRKPIPIARSTQRVWNRQWERMLMELYVGGGFGWQKWGSGHTTSAIHGALHKRKMIEVAEHPRKSLLFRLTPQGYGIAMGALGDWGREGEPPVDSPGYEPVYPKLNEDDQFLFDLWADEVKAIRRTVESMNELLRGLDADFVDQQHLELLRRREQMLTKRLRQLRRDGESDPAWTAVKVA
jgi:hypothetical protein